MPHLAKTCKTSGELIALTEQAVEVLQLRKKGKSLEQIGKQLGLTKMRIHQVIARAVASLNKEMHTLAAWERSVDLERIEGMWEGVQEKAMSGDCRAIEVALRLLERRARMYGYELPPQNAEQEAAASGGGSVTFSTTTTQKLSVENLVSLANAIRTVQKNGGGSATPQGEKAMIEYDEIAGSDEGVEENGETEQGFEPDGGDRGLEEGRVGYREEDGDGGIPDDTIPGAASPEPDA